MRAVRCSEGRPLVTQVEAPTPRGRDEVVVRVAAAGICGSDLHMLGMGLGATFGHEVAGLLPDGRPVAVEPIAPCGTCPACVTGDTQRCVRGPAMVMGVGRDGGMAERCVVPSGAVVPLPSGISVADACLVEPLAVAVHGVRRAGLVGGERVAVVGGGTIGQVAAVAAQAAGAATVAVAARHDRQREAAEQLGAAAPTGEHDVVVEAAGTASALAEAVRLCRPGGRVVLLASYWDGAVELPAMEVTMKEVTLVPASMYGRVGPSRDIDAAAALLAARPEVPAALITHRFPLDAAVEAFEMAADRASGAIKVVLEP
jgi:2-desacetyl-2-hydroxyethyl bacteriochlorophyllide A dehydrogenase